MGNYNRRLIIEIPYGGFGDHLFHSHIPRIAKETGAYDKVYISSKSLIRQQDHLDLIWKLNPYVDGFIDEAGIKCDLKAIVEKASNNRELNLLDFVMLSYGLEDNIRWHEPEIFYKPRFILDFNKIIYDPNHFTYIGDLNTNDLYCYFKKNKIKYDAIMKLRGNKALYKKQKNDEIIDAPNVYNLCDVIFSAKKILCFTSGTATLCSALGKNAIVLYGSSINRGFHHSKINTYQFVPIAFQTRLFRGLKNSLKLKFRFIF